MDAGTQATNPDIAFRLTSLHYRKTMHWADRDAADVALRKLQVLAAEVGRPDMRWIVTYFEGDWALLAGDWETAAERYEAAHDIGTEIGEPGVEALYASGRLGVALHRGRQQELAAEFGSGRRDADAHIFRIPVVGGQNVNLRQVYETLPSDAGWLYSVTIVAELAARRGDRDLIAEILDQLLPYRAVFAFATAGMIRGSVEHYIGMLAAAIGRNDEAEAAFSAAAATHESMQAPFHQARTWLEWGRFLLARGEHDRAVEVLTNARDTAAQFGCEQVERRAEQLLGQ
jgi:tetratricopeptide (TPR) repeat protein